MDPPPLAATAVTPTAPATPATPATATNNFPQLKMLDTAALHRFVRPVKRINDGADVAHFLTSKAYRDIGLFVMQLNRAMCPRKKPRLTNPESPSRPVGTYAPTQMFQSSAPRHDPEPVTKLREMLAKVEAIIDDAPLDPGPRRFGNIAFRRWHALLEERADALLRECLPDRIVRDGPAPPSASASAEEASEGGGEAAEKEAGPLDELRAYFLGAFGSSQRLDYGTGHELSFLAFLGCLWKLGVFPKQIDGPAGAVERSIVLGVIEPYLGVIRRLILTYTLEPAGSHGVWGLDDHSFLPYIFGSAQLARPLESESEPTPLEGSAPHAPRPSDVVKAAVADAHRNTWMYFSAVAFINDVKKGPFWEHSPILFDISGIRDGWGKINKGMIKMYNAEVLSKFPVVQHFAFGSLFSWDPDPDAEAPARLSAHLASQPPGTAGGPGSGTGGADIIAGGSGVAAGAATGTAAPWAQATRMPGGAAASGGTGIPYSRAPWAGGAAPSMPRGGPPDTGPPPPGSFPRGVPGTASNQFVVTKAPWAK